MLSSLYRCHDLPKAGFISSLNQFLLDTRLINNHFVCGDFNIDLLELDRDEESF